MIDKDLIYGKVPPQAKGIEKAILGAILIERDAFDNVSEIITAEAFYLPAHQLIFQAMKDVKAAGLPIDHHTVFDQLVKNGTAEAAGREHYLTELTREVVSSAHTVPHCKLVLKKFIAREIIRVCSDAISEAYEGSLDGVEVMESLERGLSGLSGHLSFGDVVWMDSVLVDAFRKIETWRHINSEVTGTPAGFRELDRATRGWQNGDLIIVAARPSVGKTALALNIVRNAANHFLQKSIEQQEALKKAGKTDMVLPQSVAIWSLEMKSWMLAIRMLAAESGEIMHKIQTGKLDEDGLKNLMRKGAQTLSMMKIAFDDKSGLTLPRLRSKARRLKRQNNLGLIVIDYLQLMRSGEKSGTREQEISTISRGLKELALELDVPIIALSQLNRDFEKRTGSNRTPMASDIRESGAIEQDADVIMMLWGPTEDEITNDVSLVSRRYLKIVKQRNGVLATINLDFKNEIQLFTDIDSLGNKYGLPSGSWRKVDPDLFTESKKRSDIDEEDPF